jgi:hypothetical protein
MIYIFLANMLKSGLGVPDINIHAYIILSDLVTFFNHRLVEIKLVPGIISSLLREE